MSGIGDAKATYLRILQQAENENKCLTQNELENKLKNYPIRFSILSVPVILRRLKKSGYVSADPRKGHKRGAKEYRVTSKGSDALRGHDLIHGLPAGEGE